MEARSALVELSRRGDEGRRWLATLVRDVARKDPGAAQWIVKLLAPHPESLADAWRATLPAAVRADIAVAVAPLYPEHKTRLERALFDPGLPRRRDLLSALAKPPLELLRRCLAVEHLAGTAFSLLLDRGWEPPAAELELAARSVAKHADPDRLCRELKEGRMWSLLQAVAALTKAMREAHVLLLRVSGKDIARDPLLWKSWIAARRDRAVDPRAAGVPGDDPVIAKALATAVFEDDGSFARRVAGHQYTCSITIMALAAVDAEKYRHKVQKLGSMLAESQLANGQWTYSLRDRYAKRGRAWPPRPHGDNSNTQYALLGLRAARAPTSRRRRGCAR